MAVTLIVVYIIYAPSIVLLVFSQFTVFGVVTRAAIGRNSCIVIWRYNKCNII